MKYSGNKVSQNTVYFAKMNEVWDAWVAEGYQPVRACVEARMARPELLVEMSVVAAKITTEKK